MAALIEITVSPADQALFNELDARVGQAMMDAGGPPDGLMSHVVYPVDEGFVVAEVWRAETEGRAYVDSVLAPMLTDLGLTLRGTTVRDVWSFARP